MQVIVKKKKKKKKPRRTEKNWGETRTLTVLVQDYAVEDREHDVIV